MKRHCTVNDAFDGGHGCMTFGESFMYFLSIRKITLPDNDVDALLLLFCDKLSDPFLTRAAT